MTNLVKHLRNMESNMNHSARVAQLAAAEIDRLKGVLQENAIDMKKMGAELVQLQARITELEDDNEQGTII